MRCPPSVGPSITNVEPCGTKPGRRSEAPRLGRPAPFTPRKTHRPVLRKGGLTENPPSPRAPHARRATGRPPTPRRQNSLSPTKPNPNGGSGSTRPGWNVVDVPPDCAQDRAEAVTQRGDLDGRIPHQQESSCWGASCHLEMSPGSRLQALLAFSRRGRTRFTNDHAGGFQSCFRFLMVSASGAVTS